MHEWGGPHSHYGEDDEAENLRESILWQMDHLTLNSVGIDIGSAGTQVIFSRLQLERMGEDLTSRYTVTERQTVFRSEVHLTPYVDETRIDEHKVGEIVAAAYARAGIRPEEVHTGAVILTGEAIRRENAQALGEVLAHQGGEFVCATAGHNMEALLAAYGSGAVKASVRQGTRVLNIDIGGGTTKFAVADRGRVISTGAFYMGGRLVVVDEEGRIVRLDPGGQAVARALGWSWQIGQRVSREALRQLADWMAEAILTAALSRPVPPELRPFFLTPVVEGVEGVDAVIFSGGVGEYVYGHERRWFNDLGLDLGQALARRVQAGALPCPVWPSDECIRATVVGASEYSVQVSGNTIYISDSRLLPMRNLQVLRPDYELTGPIEPDALASAIAEHFRRFDLVEGEADVALAFRWGGDPEYGRMEAFLEGLIRGLPNTIRRRRPIVVVVDSDIARTVGSELKEARGLENPIAVIDGISLQDFDYIDIGRKLEPAEIVPVTIKSLIFQL